MGRMTDMGVNTTINHWKIKNALEQQGHKDVEVWWEPRVSANEMCGPSGGYMISTNLIPMGTCGFSINEALRNIFNWRNFNRADPKPVMHIPV